MMVCVNVPCVYARWVMLATWLWLPTLNRIQFFFAKDAQGTAAAEHLDIAGEKKPRQSKTSLQNPEARAGRFNKDMAIIDWKTHQPLS